MMVSVEETDDDVIVEEGFVMAAEVGVGVLLGVGVTSSPPGEVADAFETA